MLKAWMHAPASVAMARVVRRAAGEPAEGTPGPGTSSVAPPSAPTLTLEVDSVRMAVSRFNGWVANAAHAAGLAVFQKNVADTILLTDRSLMMMVDKFDGILNEECQQFSECTALAEHPKRGKVALNVEYKASTSLDCAASNALAINFLKKDLL